MQGLSCYDVFNNSFICNVVMFILPPPPPQNHPNVISHQEADLLGVLAMFSRTFEYFTHRRIVYHGDAQGPFNQLKPI